MTNMLLGMALVVTIFSALGLGIAAGYAGVWLLLRCMRLRTSAHPGRAGEVHTLPASGD